MTEACYLARGAQPLKKPTTCEECFAVATCKMYENYKRLDSFVETWRERALKSEKMLEECENALTVQRLKP